MQNPGKLLKSLNMMQQRMTEAQKKLSASQFDGTTAGGLVTVTVSGEGKLLALVIHPDVIKEGADLVADLVQAAYNVAYQAKELASKEVLGAMAAGLMPLGVKIPGLG